MPARGPRESVCIDRAMEGRRPLCCNVSRADRMHSFHVRSCKGHSHRVCSLEGSTRIVGISLVPPLFQNQPFLAREHPLESWFLSTGQFPVSSRRRGNISVYIERWPHNVIEFPKFLYLYTHDFTILWLWLLKVRGIFKHCIEIRIDLIYLFRFQSYNNILQYDFCHLVFL